MSFLACSAAGTDHLANLRRLIAARWAALALMTVLTLATPGLLDIPLPMAPLPYLQCGRNSSWIAASAWECMSCQPKDRATG